MCRAFWLSKPFESSDVIQKMKRESCLATHSCTNVSPFLAQLEDMDWCNCILTKYKEAKPVPFLFARILVKKCFCINVSEDCTIYVHDINKR